MAFYASLIDVTALIEISGALETASNRQRVHRYLVHTSDRNEQGRPPRRLLPASMTTLDGELVRDQKWRRSLRSNPTRRALLQEL